uniref:Uncharacterized protein n=1 Tax=Phaeomonas parva TaxID=124430 RepID=A0A7S1XRL9_9STRA|mmetsp:Transcript_28071/g.89613  ORF Transcript_28071/g.89613 Transcript_28071/m.89613 type:complete len:470 (+) Transcript_28071:160-1569(+)
MGAAGSVQAAQAAYASLPDNASDVATVAAAREEVDRVVQWSSQRTDGKKTPAKTRNALKGLRTRIAANGVSKADAKAIIVELRRLVSAESAPAPAGRKGKKKGKGGRKGKGKKKGVPPRDPVDPWRQFKSAYGGRMSPAEEWQKLQRERNYAAVEIAATDGKAHVTPASFGAAPAAGDAPPSDGDAAADTTSQEAGDAVPQGPNMAFVRVARAAVSDMTFDSDVLDQLVGLSLPFNHLEAQPSVLVDLLRAKDDVKIAIRELDVQDNWLSAVPQLQRWPKLLSLNLAFNRLESPTKASFAPNLSLTLRRLSLRGCALQSLSDSGGDFILGGLNCLESLDVAQNDFPDAASLEPCKGLRGMGDFTALPNPFEQSPATQEVFKELLRSWPRLKMFNGCEHVSGLGQSSFDFFSAALERSLDADTLEASTGRTESCSCIEGNACAVPDGCKDWANRFEVARAAREENYMVVF